MASRNLDPGPIRSKLTPNNEMNEHPHRVSDERKSKQPLAPRSCKHRNRSNTTAQSTLQNLAHDRNMQIIAHYFIEP
jgi:hypothetical protein